MNIAEGVTAAVIFLTAGGLWFLSLRHRTERGFLLNNAYIYASREERETMDKRPYYRQSAVVFFLLGLLFAVTGISLVLQNDGILLIGIPIVLGTVVYAVTSTARIEERRKKAAAQAEASGAAGKETEK